MNCALGIQKIFWQSGKTSQGMNRTNPAATGTRP